MIRGQINSQLLCFSVPMRDYASIRGSDSLGLIRAQLLCSAIRVSHANKIIPTPAKLHFRHGAHFTAGRTRSSFASWLRNNSRDCNPISCRGTRSRANRSPRLVCDSNGTKKHKCREKEYFGNFHGVDLTPTNTVLLKKSGLHRNRNARTAFSLDIGKQIRVHLRVSPARRRADLRPGHPRTPCKSAPSSFA